MLAKDEVPEESISQEAIEANTSQISNDRELDPSILFSSLAKVLQPTRQPTQFIIKTNKVPTRYLKSPYAVKLQLKPRTISTA